MSVTIDIQDDKGVAHIWSGYDKDGGSVLLKAKELTEDQIKQILEVIGEAD